MKHHIIVYGCQMNRSDAERINSLFESLGSKISSKPEEADTVIVVMCSVRQMAADRVIGLHQKINFEKIKAKNPEFISILTGCIVENDKEKFREIFDYILDIKKLAAWPKITGLKASYDNKDYFHILPKQSCSFSALIPISKGCDNYCTYCVVPYTRGKLESRPSGDILKEVKEAVKNKAKEIWLIGQNVNNYHWKNIDFAQLLELVNNIPGDFWIRFTSPHPKDFNDAAIDAMAKYQKITPYLNLPVQSGDDSILKSMGRPYTAASYEILVKKIRQSFKKHRSGTEKIIAISTDIIVGFPGETKIQFLNSAKLFRKIKYDMAYIAQYSRRAGTSAAKLDDNVPAKEKKYRENCLNNILKKTALIHNKKFVGKTVEVLVDCVKKETFGKKIRYFGLGKTRHYKTAKFPMENGKINPGDIINIKINKAQSFGLIGEISNGKQKSKK